MIARTVAWSARHSLFVLLVTLVAAAGSYFTQRSLARDALPDLADPQIVLDAEWMGHSAEEVAGEVTEKLSRELEGVPGSKAIRGSSMAQAVAGTTVVHDQTHTETFGDDICGPRANTTTFRVRTQVEHLTERADGTFNYAFMETGTYAVDFQDRAAHEGLRRCCKDVSR